MSPHALSAFFSESVFWGLEGNRPIKGESSGVLQAFLAHNGLKLVIRSHEGPDARHRRAPEERMGSISEGYSVDAVCKSK